jgi:hypothetical protein
MEASRFPGSGNGWGSMETRLPSSTRRRGVGQRGQE